MMAMDLTTRYDPECGELCAAVASAAVKACHKQLCQLLTTCSKSIARTTNLVGRGGPLLALQSSLDSGADGEEQRSG